MENSGRYFEVKITPESKKKHDIQDELPVLVLAPFNKPPKLQFDNIKLGTSKVQHLVVRNPNVQAIEIQLENLPPKDNGFRFSDVNFTVGGRQEKVLEIEVTPTEVGKWRHVIQVKGNHRLKLDITITGSCVDPRKGKKNVKLLRARNSTSNVLAVKTGVKTCSQTRNTVGLGEKKKSPFRSPPKRTTNLPVSRMLAKRATNSDNLKLNDGYDVKNENFVTIKDNKLPPCVVVSTPTRRKTYLIKGNKENKENIKQSHISLKSRKPQNVANSRLNLRKPETVVTDTQDTIKSRNTVDPSLELTSKNIKEFDNTSTVENSITFSTPPEKHIMFGNENRQSILRRETFDSHPGQAVERRKHILRGTEKSTPAKSNSRNFKDMLDSLCLTPTSTSQFELEHFISSEGRRLPSFVLSPSNRRMTYNVQLDSKLESESLNCAEEPESNFMIKNESVLCTEEVIYSARRVRHSVAAQVYDSPGVFYDSLDNVFDEKVETKNFTKKWTEWQKCDSNKSSTSSGGFNETHSDSCSKTPVNLIRNTGLTAKLNDLNLTSGEEESFIIGSPIDFSILPPNEDSRRCSTIMKNFERVHFSPGTSKVCKDLFFVDSMYTSTQDPLHSDDLSRLSSDTFVKSESSLPDCSLYSADINNQEHFKKQTGYHVGTELEMSLLPEENTAKNVIEAGLWVKEIKKDNVVVPKSHNDYVRNLETIGEESMEVHLAPFSQSTINNSESQTVKLEKTGTAGTYIEISPPKNQIDIFTSTAGQEKKVSGIKGWSKFSEGTRKPLQLKSHKETVPQIHETSSLTGKKRHTDGSQSSEITNKRRVLNDGSVCEDKNNAAGKITKKPLKNSILRSAILKLSLSTKKKPKEETVKLHNPDAFLSSLAKPNVFGAMTTSEPFTTSSVYYEEEWLQQQEKEFTKWLNSILTPPAELDSTTEIPKVDVAELWAQSCRKQEIELAPTREMVSSQYHTQHRLDALRKAACTLFHSEEIAQVLSKVAVHVDKKLIVIRGDRDLHLDFGLKCNVMRLLLNYNPLWLRIGLETVYGQTIPLESNSDVRGLTKFIMTRLLSDPFILSQYTHPTVSHLYLAGFDEAMKKFTLKKFLLLVYFLDKAKEKRLISHDPCLFCRDAKLKNTREILLSFSRDLLSGIGDITKHLKSLGCVVTQNQTYLDEFEYAVSCLGIDLRDGIRLTRVMEIILQNRSLLCELRVPAVSRLQKVHNVSVALSALKDAGYVLTGDITPKDICDGHREKTLSLLWQIIYKFQIPRFGAAATKIQKWWRHQSLKLEIERRIRARHMAKLTAAAITIQCSWRKYSAQRKFKVLKEEMEHKLAAHHKAAIVIQKNWKMYMNYISYKQTLKSVKKIQAWYRRVRVVKCERSHFLRRRQVFVNFQSYCRGYLYRKRLESLQRTAAALKIQTWYRRQIISQKIKSLIPFVKKCIEEKHMSTAAIVIQRRLRATLQMKAQRKEFLRLKTAVVTIQNRFRAIRLAKYQRQVYMEQKSAAILLQNKFRARKLMKSERQKFLQLREAAINIQRKFKATKLMREQRRKYQLQRSSAIAIQSRFRAKRLMLAERQNFLCVKNAAIKIQTAFRAILLMRKERQLYLIQRSAAITIQNKFRAMKLMQSEKLKFFQLKRAALTIQRKYRALKLMRQQKQEYQLQRSAAMTIQNKFRATLAMKLQRKHFLNMRTAVIAIQNRIRATRLMKYEREIYLKQKTATVFIQQKFRAMKLMKEESKIYQIKRRAAIAIQRHFRAKKQMQLQREEFLRLRKAAIMIQTRFRALKSMREERQKYQLLRSAVFTVQTKFRATKEMKSKRHDFLQLKNATQIIQRRFRANMLMREQRQKYQLQRAAAVTIQNAFRESKLLKIQRENFLKVRKAVTVIQKRFRATLLMRRERERFLSLRSAAIIIQRKLRAKTQMQLQRKTFYDQRLAAVKIQTWYRATVLMRSERQKFLLQKHSAIVIQNKFRAFKLMASERQNFLKQRNAAVIIQKRFRALRQMKKDKSHFQLLKSVVVKLQCRYRAKLVMRRERESIRKKNLAARVIQRQFRNYMLRKNNDEMLEKRREEKKRIAAAIKIQALWRGYAVRKTGTLAMKTVRERALSTVRNGLPDRTLRTRAYTALNTFEKTCSGRLIWALMELNVITMLSPKLCVDIASGEVVNKIFYHISNANRSEVYKEVCTVATKVLINLTKYKKTVHSVWQIPGNITIIANIMLAWCGKNDEIFCNCCTLLWLFAKDEERAKEMSKDEYLKQRLRYCHKQLKLKQDRSQSSVKGPSTSKVKHKTKFTLPSAEPDWALKECLQRTFENPSHAVICVMKVLKLL